MSEDPKTQEWWEVVKTIAGTIGRTQRWRVVGKYGRSIPSGLAGRMENTISLFWKVIWAITKVTAA